MHYMLLCVGWVMMSWSADVSLASSTGISPKGVLHLIPYNRM